MGPRKPSEVPHSVPGFRYSQDIVAQAHACMRLRAQSNKRFRMAGHSPRKGAQFLKGHAGHLQATQKPCKTQP